MRIPDFFIIGAPKCGTNALYSYLGGHPHVFMPALKEPQYFCHDFPGLAQVRNQDDYTRLFEVAPAGAVLGEASVWYLYSEVAVPAIRAANPATKLIVILRNPIDAAYSLHTQFLRSLKETEDDFEAAWNLQEPRHHGRGCRATAPSHGACSTVRSAPSAFRSNGSWSGFRPAISRY